MKKIFKKQTYVKFNIETTAVNLLIIEKFNDVDFCNLQNFEKEKILQIIVNENKEKLILKIEIKNQYFLINKFFQLISKLK